MIERIPRAAPLLGAALLAACGLAGASSHREAPFITTTPKVDGTDFYMFRSYEPGRSGYRDADRQLPAAAGRATAAPTTSAMDPNALYEIHIDNNGDAKRRPDLPVPLHQHPVCRRHRHQH